MSKFIGSPSPQSVNLLLVGWTLCRVARPRPALPGPLDIYIREGLIGPPLAYPTLRAFICCRHAAAIIIKVGEPRNVWEEEEARHEGRKGGERSERECKYLRTR